tara:strand:- start:7028 stop:7336 length:309 start_codon:yes stop_codon:yes gene_type:complete
MQAPSLILAATENGFHLAILGAKVQPVIDIEADTESDAMAAVKSILVELPEMGSWSGDIETSGLHILNLKEASSRWLIDFSPDYENVNATLLTPTIPKGWSS